MAEEKAPVRVKAEFKKRKIREGISAVIGTVLAISIVDVTHGDFLKGLVLLMALLIPMMMFTHWNRRCPACTHPYGQGRGWWFQKQCARCGVQLQD